MMSYDTVWLLANLGTSCKTLIRRPKKKTIKGSNGHKLQQLFVHFTKCGPGLAKYCLETEISGAIWSACLGEGLL